MHGHDDDEDPPISESYAARQRERYKREIGRVDQLNAWQAFPSSLAGLRSVEAISEVDQALTTLLQALREAQS